MDKFLAVTSAEKFAKKFVQILHAHETFSGAVIGVAEIKGTRYLVKASPNRIRNVSNFAKVKGLVDEIEAENRIVATLRDVLEGVSPCVIRIPYSAMRKGVVELARPLRCLELSRTLHFNANRPAPIVVTGELCNWAAEVQNGLCNDEFAIQVMEMCESSVGDFLYHYQNTQGEFVQLKSILFHIIWFFMVTTSRFPKFRHKDMHMGNIMLKADPKFTLQWSAPKFIAYELRRDSDVTTFYVPYFGYTPRIIDYGFAELPEEGIRSVMSLDMEVNRQCHGSDVARLLFNIYGSRAASSPKTVELLEEIDPSRNYEYGQEVGRGLVDKMPALEEMIRSNAFTDYTKPVPKSAVHSVYGVEGCALPRTTP